MHTSKNRLRYLLAAAMAAGLVACGGGGGDGGGAEGGSGAGDAPGRLYIGYYAEDPLNNPEDPTVGVVMFRVPDADGSFAGQMPFSYAGCTAGVDTGTISGTRSGNTLQGNWSGVMDGSVSVGGTLQAVRDAATDSYGGSFSNAAGKVEVRMGACRYFIAAGGSFRVWGEDTRQPAGFTATATPSTRPTFGWTTLDAGALYTVRVFDLACARERPGDPACFLGESQPSTGLSAAYPEVFPGAATLQVGTEYLAVVTAQNGGTGAFAGFTSVRFTPVTMGGTGAAGPGTGTETAPGSGGETGSAYGALTIEGASMGTRFDPAATPQGTAELSQTGPNFNTGSGLYGSALVIAWSERDALGGLWRSVGVALSSTTSTAPGAQPGEQVSVINVNYNQTLPTAQAATYNQQCGEPASILVHCPAVALMGVTWDLVARTVTFDNTVLPGTGSSTGSVTLNGTLRY